MSYCLLLFFIALSGSSFSCFLSFLICSSDNCICKLNSVFLFLISWCCWCIRCNTRCWLNFMLVKLFANFNLVQMTSALLTLIVKFINLFAFRLWFLSLACWLSCICLRVCGLWSLSTLWRLHFWPTCGGREHFALCLLRCLGKLRIC